jgi:DNA-binding GntR family transcriptional regulator
MSVDPESETPVYQQVADILRARIMAGEITRRLPSLKSVEQEMGVSHGSIERAFALLRSEGLIRPVTGKGFFVIPPQERG